MKTSPLVQGITKGYADGRYILWNVPITGSGLLITGDVQFDSDFYVSGSAIFGGKNDRGDLGLYNRTSDPASPSEGDIWYNTTDNTWYGWNGTAKITLGSGAGAGGTGYWDRLGTTLEPQTPTDTVTLHDKLQWGTLGSEDTNIYRSGADVLATDDALNVYGSGNYFGQSVTLKNTAKLLWGSSVGTEDTNIYRTGANILATDDNLYIFGTATNWFEGKLSLGSPNPTQQFEIFNAAHWLTYSNNTGNGSIDNPWIIQDYYITTQISENGIYVHDTTDHFIIRNCTILNRLAGYAGIRLQTVVNGRIENCTLNNNAYGIWIRSSSYIQHTRSWCR